MTEQEVRTMVVNRVDDFLENLFEKHIKDRAKMKIEAAFKDDDLRIFLHRKTKKAVEEMCDKATRPELIHIIKKLNRPKIIYVQEPPKIPAQLIPLNVQEHFMAPVTPCVYFLCREDRIVYIGQSINISQRMAQHIPYKNFDRVFYINVHAEDLNAVESELIEYYNPELNRKDNVNETKTLTERQRR